MGLTAVAGQDPDPLDEFDTIAEVAAFHYKQYGEEFFRKLLEHDGDTRTARFSRESMLSVGGPGDFAGCDTVGEIVDAMVKEIVTADQQASFSAKDKAKIVQVFTDLFSFIDSCKARPVVSAYGYDPDKGRIESERRFARGRELRRQLENGKSQPKDKGPRTTGPADEQRLADVRFTPKSRHVQCNQGCPLWAKSGHWQNRTSGYLFDHLVGAREESGWHVETERFGGGQVDDQIEFGRLLDRKIAGLRPAQNFVHIVGGVPELSQVVWSVGHETPGLDMIASIKDCRQPRAERKRDDAGTVRVNECIVHDVKCVRLGFERVERGCNILRSVNREWRNFNAERTSRGLNLAHLQHRLGSVKINHDCQPAKSGHDLTQELEPLAGNIGRLDR
jgi:hypothetical protein